MEQILLTSDEIFEASLRSLESIARDQLKKVAKWGNEACPHGTLTEDTSKAFKRECNECWQALLKEAGLGG